MEISPPQLKRMVEGNLDLTFDSSNSNRTALEPALGNKKNHLFTIAYETGCKDSDYIKVDSQEYQNQNFKLCLLGATWFGDRVGLIFSGMFYKSIKKNYLRIEVRTDDYNSLVAFKKNFTNFLANFSSHIKEI